MPPPPDLTADAYQRHRRELDAQCRETGVPFVDCAPFIKKEEDSGRRLYWDYDDHLRPEANRMLGEALFAWWRQQR